MDAIDILQNRLGNKPQAATTAPTDSDAASVLQGRMVGAAQPQVSPKKKGLLRQLAESEVNAMPWQGGMLGMGLGGMAGAPAGGIGAVPGSIAGGALGGMAGEAGSQLGRRLFGMDAPGSSGQAAQQIGSAGLGQGALAAGGEGVSALVKGAAPYLMQAAMKATPEVAQTALENGIKATRGGLAKLEGVMNEARAGVNSVVSNFQRMNPKVNYDPVDIARQVVARMAPAIDSLPDKTKALSQITDNVEGFINSQGGRPITPQTARAYFSSANRLASPAYNTLGRGQLLDPETDAVWHKNLAGVLRDALVKDIDGGPTVPGGTKGPLESAFEQLHKLTALKQTLVPAGKKSAGAMSDVLTRLARPTLTGMAGAAAGAAADRGNPTMGALAGGAAGAGLGTPSMMSMIANGMQNPALLGGLAAAPQLVGQMLNRPAQR